MSTIRFAAARGDAGAVLADAPGSLPLPLEAVFVAPGDEIYVDHEAGFLKCVLADGCRAFAEMEWRLC